VHLIRALNGARGRVYATPRVLRHSSCARTPRNSLRSWDAHFVCWVASHARLTPWHARFYARAVYLTLVIVNVSVITNSLIVIVNVFVVINYLGMFCGGTNIIYNVQTTRYLACMGVASWLRLTPPGCRESSHKCLDPSGFHP
jgi:hypothetical protein